MSWKPSLWLAILVVLATLFILVFERKPESSSLALPLDLPLLQINPSAVTRLFISSGELSIECVRREGRWFLTRPVEARADEARIRRIIEALANSRVRETLPPERLLQRRLTSASFGLASPRVRFLVGSELRSDEILMGDMSPFGDLVYFRLKGGPDVIGATCSLGDILPIDLETMRDHSVFPSSLKRVVRLEVKHSGGFLQLGLREGQWRIQQPVDVRADNRRVEEVIQSLMALKIHAFGPAEAPADPAVFGLTPDEAAMQVSLTPEGGGSPLVLMVGKVRQDTPSLLHAKISDVPSIGSIHREILALQSVTVEYLRDRRLCNADPASIVSIMLREGDSKLVLGRQDNNGWIIMEPFRYKADAQSVGRLLRAICDMQFMDVASAATIKLLHVATTELNCRLSIATIIPPLATTNPAPAKLLEGSSWSYRFSLPKAGATNSVVYSEESKLQLDVLSRELAGIWPESPAPLSLIDPRPYMDRRMIGIPPDQVRRITLFRQGREETVSVGNAGVWIADSPPDGMIIKGAIPALLGISASLMADRVESMSSTNLSNYGIDESSPRVTFGLTGERGIQKTVLLGMNCGTTAVYSAVQGQDMVFVLRKEMAQALMRSLIESR